MASAEMLFVNNASDVVWVSDGTAAGTLELALPAGSGVNVTPFVTFGDSLLFLHTGEFSDQIFITNGTAAGTSEITVSSTIYLGVPDIAVFGDKVLILDNITSATGRPPTVEFLVTNGTSAGTTTFTIAGPPLPLAFNPGPFTGFGNMVAFSATDYSGLTSLWVSNGTAAGTKPLAVAGAGKSGLVPQNLAAFGADLLFGGTDTNGHVGLWVTDGTAAGTHELVADFSLAPIGAVLDVDPRDITVFGDKALFNGGEGLWITDGTSAGTKELVAPGSGVGKLFAPNDITVFGGKALFEGGGGGSGLWVTDGTAAGTNELKVANASTYGLQGTDFTVLGDKVLFVGEDAAGHSGLWVTDGTSAGTSEISVPNAYFYGVFDHTSSGSQMAVIGNEVEFQGINSLGVDGLWVTNGTAAGTKEIFSPIFADDLTSIPVSSPALAPAPSGLSFAVAADKGAKGDTFRIAGKGGAGDTVTLYDGKTAIGTAKVAATGLWSLTTASPLAIGSPASPLAAGAHILSASEVDVAGNKSAASAAQGLTVERAAPNAVVFVGGGVVENFTGGAGNDIFEFSAANLVNSDIVKGGGGVNKLEMTSAGTVRGAGVSGVEIYQLGNGGADSLTLSNANFAGVTGAITVDGGNDGNRLSEAGAAAADKAILKGGAGADTLIAGHNATLTGGAGADVFWFTTPGSAKIPDTNTITDFTHASDKIAVSNAGFGLGLAGASGTPKALPASLFTANTAGKFGNASERFAYDTANGGLYYDAHGNAAGSSRELVATLTNHPTVSASNVFFVS